METITIIDQDRVDAENFLEQYLTDRVPNGDFRKGNVLRDMAVGALASIFAYLRREVDYIKARQSLLLLGALTGTDVDRAADEILSNWFITRRAGTYARGTATLYLTTNDPYTVPATARFYRADGTAFGPDFTADRLYGETDMTPVLDESGVVSAYTIRVPVVALSSGVAGNVETGAFTDYSPRSARIQRVENTTVFAGGQDVESTAEMLERAETAISTRNMVSGRSIDATLREEFEELESVVVIGYGDQEMVRDLIFEEATNTWLHVGGHADAYLRSPILESQLATGVVGALFSDPRPGLYILQDDLVDFLAAGVVRGDILSIKNGLITEPQQYVVNAVTPYGLYVSRRSYFPRTLPIVIEDLLAGTVGPTIGNWPVVVPGRSRLYAGAEYTFQASDVGRYIRVKGSGVGNDGTWEIIGVNDAPVHGSNYATLLGATFADETVAWELQERPVEYSVGSLAPSYDNKIASRITGRFTRNVQVDGVILMPFHPVYKVRSVWLDDPLNTTGYAVGGRVTFLTRVNGTPADPLGNPNDLQYQLECSNYGEGQSGWQLLSVVVGWAANPTLFNGFTLNVEYDTISSYADVWDYMLDEQNRQVCASSVPRGLHPVYLALQIDYKLARTATTVFDTAAAAQALADHVNAFPNYEELDASDIVAFLRSTYDELGYTVVTAITYTLIAPDGRQIPYATSEVLSVDPAYQTGVLAVDRLDDPQSQGVSANTVRYILQASDILFTEV